MNKQSSDTDTQTVGEWIDRVERSLAGFELFYGHGTDNPGSEAQWLVSHVCSVGIDQELTTASPVSAEQQTRIVDLLERRTTEKIPLAYLLEEAWFAGRRFFVDERVLVPRSPIAELIDRQFVPFLAGTPKRILDLCCGSGCIGIACALAFPESKVVLADVSAEALEVAQINIRHFELEGRVDTVQSDLFGAIDGTFDLIVCNPPYVSNTEYQALPAEYHHEPELGLVSESEGLALPLQILDLASFHLKESGLLILETGYTWPALEDALPRLRKIWLEFEFGGEGVCVIKASDLQGFFHSEGP